ncbi:hypothetical protein KDN34_06860 [Shewanella yunxiaonensis]|uniref:Uncharacterized protein n=1 Tax=Shewanella yunxiaonensis TaxID=2829809 RepID=A0ABX7YWF2_9GAMM|nr:MULTISPECIES: hypothetical protein [Shewanella]MDF0533532.1 hypothetical protein [Shewanella sp. A32]QUN07143.1 hypothetical protein KDN34_06860 [Shewanella yunxiaonensis]
MIVKQLVWAAMAIGVSSSALAGEAEQAFTSELHQCAAYYQLGSQMVAAMNAPQMAAVGERLKNNAKEAEQLAAKYESEDAAQQAITKATEEMMQSTGGKGMGALMQRYKDKCQDILNDPQKRLDYWVMAKM